MAAQTLSPEQLLTRCDPASLTLTDAQAEADAPGIVGQPRAAAAVEYALATPHAGHHLFVAGPPGSGRRALVRQAVQQRLRDDGITRSDWVYVNRFDAPHKPLALELPAGRGTALRDDMKSLVRDLRTMIRTMFESEEYATEVERIDTEFKQRAEQAFIEVGHKAQRRGLAMVRTPVGFTVAPQKDGEVMPPPVFESLPEEQRAELQKAMAEVQEQLVRALRASMRLRKEHAERVREMNRSMTRVAAEHALEEIRERHADLPKVAAWLDAVAADVVEHADDFRAPADEDGNTSEAGEAGEDHGDLSRYEVNLLLDASAADGVGLVEADLPTVPNLVGRVDHIARFGMLLTDFRLIKGGLLHRANGGHLLIDAVQLLSQPYAWQTLKRALRRGEIRIEAVAEQLGLISTVQLEPEPIPLKLKVVLVGTREICALLQAYDDEFDQRVAASHGAQPSVSSRRRFSAWWIQRCRLCSASPARRHSQPRRTPRACAASELTCCSVSVAPKRVWASSVISTPPIVLPAASGGTSSGCHSAQPPRLTSSTRSAKRISGSAGCASRAVGAWRSSGRTR
jgi:predicted ATP-dependent protease